MLAFVVTYLLVGFQYGYVWSESSSTNGQVGLGPFITLLYSTAVALVAGLIAIVTFARREFKKAKSQL